jgi:ribosomal protein L35
MGKMKTKKSIIKRFTLTKGGKKGGKVEKRTCGQGHFNSRETGNVGRNKKSDIIVGTKRIARTIKRSI